MDKGKDKKPVVLQVLPELETGGIEIGTVEIATGLQQAGIKNFVASKGGRMEYDLNKIGVFHLKLNLKSKNPFVILSNAKKLEKFIKENDINIVHARSRAPAWSAYLAAKRAGVKFVTTFHGTYGLGPWGIKKIYNKVMTFGDLVIVISNHIKSHILKNYNASESKLRLVHRCASIETFSPEAVTSERMINKIKEYNIAEDKPVILLPGRVTHWKGAHLLVEALAKMKNQNYYCIIAGDIQNRQSYLDSLKELARQNKLLNRIGFFGKYSYNELPPLMMVSTIVLNTAIEPEAFGRTTVEGLAMGRIVIASDIGGSLDIIEDGISGKLFKNGDVQSLADALDWALSLSQTEKEKIGEAAIKRARENFTKQKMCENTIKVYNEVLNMN